MDGWIVGREEEEVMQESCRTELFLLMMRRIQWQPR
jgi:hypothetical protein